MEGEEVGGEVARLRLEREGGLEGVGDVNERTTTTEPEEEKWKAIETSELYGGVGRPGTEEMSRGVTARSGKGGVGANGRGRLLGGRERTGAALAAARSGDEGIARRKVSCRGECDDAEGSAGEVARTLGVIVGSGTNGRVLMPERGETGAAMAATRSNDEGKARAEISC